MVFLDAVKTFWAPIITLGTGVWFFAQLDSRMSLAEQKYAKLDGPVVEEKIRRLHEDLHKLNQTVHTIQTNQIAVCVATNAKCHY